MDIRDAELRVNSVHRGAIVDEPEAGVFVIWCLEEREPNDRRLSQCHSHVKLS